ncbi:MAG: hypothetical protein LBN71_09470 [Tannerella sp.]|jgi:hypothetical protein|nr:hypothetical protein [Tannerella sp.]
MKVQLTKGIITLFCLMLTLTAYSQNQTAKQADKKTLSGIWTYSLPDAPYGYQDGTIEFKQVEGKLAAVLKVGDTPYQIKEIKKDGNNYKSNFYVDGNEVSVKLIPGNGKITGNVTIGDYDMPVTLTPKK